LLNQNEIKDKKLDHLTNKGNLSTIDTMDNDSRFPSINNEGVLDKYNNVSFKSI